MDGTRPMIVNPIPKTSNGVKLRLNSAHIVGHACYGLAKERRTNLACIRGWPAASHRHFSVCRCWRWHQNQNHQMQQSGFVQSFCPPRISQRREKRLILYRLRGLRAELIRNICGYGPSSSLQLSSGRFTLYLE